MEMSEYRCGIMEGVGLCCKFTRMPAYPLEHSAGVVADFPKLAQFLEWFPKRNKDLDHDALNQAAYSILPEEQFTALAKFLNGNTFDKTAAKWEFYLKSSRMFSL